MCYLLLALAIVANSQSTDILMYDSKGTKDKSLLTPENTFPATAMPAVYRQLESKYNPACTKLFPLISGEDIPLYL